MLIFGLWVTGVHARMPRDRYPCALSSVQQAAGVFNVCLCAFESLFVVTLLLEVARLSMVTTRASVLQSGGERTIHSAACARRDEPPDERKSLNRSRQLRMHTELLRDDLYLHALDPERSP